MIVAIAKCGHVVMSKDNVTEDQKKGIAEVWEQMDCTECDRLNAQRRQALWERELLDYPMREARYIDACKVGERTAIALERIADWLEKK